MGGLCGEELMTLLNPGWGPVYACTHTHMDRDRKPVHPVKKKRKKRIIRNIHSL